MKRVISILLVFVVVLTLLSVTACAQAMSSEEAEKAIMLSYLKAELMHFPVYIKEYVFPVIGLVLLYLIYQEIRKGNRK